MVLTRGRMFALACVAATAVVSCAREARPTTVLPAITLTDTAGGRTTLPDDLARAKLTVIVFFSEHCPCFAVHEQRLRDLSREYGPKGVQVLVVDSEVSASQARDASSAAARGLAAIAVDPGAKLADALDAEYATYTVVFDERGRVRYRGGVDSDKNVLHDDTKHFLRDALDDLLAGREPRKADEKVLGCPLQKH